MTMPVKRIVLFETINYINLHPVHSSRTMATGSHPTKESGKFSTDKYDRMKGVRDVSFDVPMLNKVAPIVNNAMIGAPVTLEYKNKHGSISGRVVDIWFFDNRHDPHVRKFGLRTDDVVGEDVVDIANFDGELKIDSLHGDEFESLTVNENANADPLPVPTNVAGWELFFQSPWGAMWCTPPIEEEKTYGTITTFETVTIIPTLKDGEWACLPAVRSHSSFKTQHNGWHTFDEDDILAYAVNRMECKPQREASQWFRGDNDTVETMSEKKQLLQQYNY